MPTCLHLSLIHISLEQIVPMTDDVQFKAELLRQRNVYHQLNQEAHTAIEALSLIHI